MLLKKYNLHTFLFLLVFLPYAVPIVKGSDNQPVLFILLFFLLFGIRVRTKFLVFFLLVNIYIISNMLFTWSLDDQFVNKYVAYFQFLLSILVGFHFKINNIHRNFNFDFIVYFYTFFSFVHVASSGLIESFLINSRDINYYMDVGRGISTLSPEPSFLGMTLFSLYVFSVINKINISKFAFLLIIANMTFTFSLYSFLLISVIFVHKYGLKAIAGIILFCIFLISFFDIPYRALMLFSHVFQNDFSILLEDRSIQSRIQMVENSVSVFLFSPYFGIGFFEYSLNGMLSLLSSFGIVFILIFFSYFFFVLVFSHNKFLVFSFILLFFFTNSISVSYFGFILTYILLVALNNAKSFNIARCL